MFQKALKTWKSFAQLRVRYVLSAAIWVRPPTGTDSLRAHPPKTKVASRTESSESPEVSRTLRPVFVILIAAKGKSLLALLADCRSPMAVASPGCGSVYRWLWSPPDVTSALRPGSDRYYNNATLSSLLDQLV